MQQEEEAHDEVEQGAGNGDNPIPNEGPDVENQDEVEQGAGYAENNEQPHDEQLNQFPNEGADGDPEDVSSSLF